MSEVTTETDLVIMVKESGVPDEISKSLIEAFEPFMLQAKEWNEKAKKVTVTDISQVREMMEARNARLALKNIRVSVEKRRKELKENYLVTSKAIDGVAKFITALIEPTEDYLQDQESFKVRYEEQQKELLCAKRMAELKEFEVDGSFYQLGTLPNDQYESLLESSRRAKEHRGAEAKSAEEARLAEEIRVSEEGKERARKEAEEREAVRLENERLKAEREESEKLYREKEEKRSIRVKAIQPYMEFGAPLDLLLILEFTDEEFETTLADKKKAHTEHVQAEAERKRVEAAAAAEIERLTREAREREAEVARLAKEEEDKREAELNMGDKDKMVALNLELIELTKKYEFKSKKSKAIYQTVGELVVQAAHEISKHYNK